MDVASQNLPSASTTPVPSDWRRAFAVDDLQLSPALCLRPGDSLQHAQALAYQHEYSILPIVSSSRSLLGYLDLHPSSPAARPPRSDEAVSERFTKFARNRPYTVITPDTDLLSLGRFLEHHDFAIVTDLERKFVLGVATREDLHKFAERFAPNNPLI